MPATWGYGNTGSEPITMAAWGFATDLAGTAPTLAIVTLLSATVVQPTITASCPALSITASVPQPVLSSVTVKNDIT